MVNIEITTVEMQRFNRQVDKYSKETQTKIKKEIERTTINVERKAKMNVKKNDFMGSRSAVAGQISRSVKDFTGTVRSTHKAAVFIEEGTRPHVIKPVRARFLAFNVGTAGSLKTGRITSGKEVFTKEVHHPGTRPEPYMEPAAKDEHEFFAQRIYKLL